MLAGVQPCFQLLRIGSSAGDSARDLYTFRPAQNHSVFRLGRAAELCDVTLDSPSVSRIHAEVEAERETVEGDEAQEEEGWRVHIKDRSSHGTWVNEVRLQPGIQWELSDGDTLIFGGQTAPGNPEFYFLFQKVKVRPLDFDAITLPKAGTFSSDLQNRIRTSLDRKVAANLDLSKLSINRATVILNSIGSLSKMKGSAWTFKRSHSHEGTVSDPGTSTSPPLAVGFSSLLLPSTPPSFTSAASLPQTKALPQTSRSRRKSAHTVLLEDDSSDEPRSRGVLAGVVEDGQRARGKKRRRLYKSESEGFSLPPPPQLQPKTHSDIRRPLEAKPFPVGIRTIGSFHGAMTNSRLNEHLFQASFTSKQEVEKVNRVKTVVHGNIAAFRQQKPAHCSPTAARGRRRANSSPVFSPLVVGGENYNLASPSVRIRADERVSVQFNRFHHPTGKRRGRPRKHPLPPRPSLPSPSSSSSSSTSSASSSSGSSSSSSDEDEDDEEEDDVMVGTVEPCAAPRCRLPQQDTVQWIQCDVCDAWYHIDCLHVDRKKLLMDPNADFHCGCR
ncbi:transcription factor 19 [Oreochromis niloticus]|uniref:Transcription factor 19 (SC1), like n=2 Tax=Oreochromis TaxID=8139 RepID=I3JBJ5_ORENI|nr:transcription factor 19 [Oreochromis niloticus]XP_005459142.1 transcription factor 19 [Oreochromis niloticus]XP_031610643.2 transcription factor 19 [Oreochromis aureus]XP_031610644.2 transcription factor 19 [Oreochromis aureus]